MADPRPSGLAEFSAAELDHLEDALESLELAPPRETEPHLRRRLDDYRNILALSRAAMPMIDVPGGLLDGVLAEARASTEVPAMTPSAASTEQPGFWARLRRFGLLPGVALAGTAAIVMLMVDRGPDAKITATADSKAAAGVELPRENNARADVASSPLTAAPPAGTASTVTADAPNAVAVPAIAPEPTPGATPTPALQKRGKADGKDVDLEGRLTENADEAAEGEDQAIGTKQEEKVADSDTPRWDIIARGDRARHRGDCGVARNEYALALDDVDARVRARAHAGLGLCDAAGGDRSSADAAYKVARDLDGEIVAFIDDERPRGGGAAPAKAKPKAATKAKPKSEVPTQTQNNAFDPME